MTPAGSAGVAWPVWTVPVGLVAGGTAGQFLAALVLLPLAAAGVGDGDITGATLLLASIAFGAALLGTIALTVRSTGRLSARSLGLETTPLLPALAWAALGGALIAAFVFFWSHAVDLSDLFAVPSEVDGRSSLAERLAVGGSLDRADADPNAFASALARVVVPAILAEVVLRGFALPALARWRGERLALAITAILTLAPVGFALGIGNGGDALLPVALLLGLVLGLLYLRTRSLLPGIALSAAVLGAGLGEAFAWSAAGIALLATACCISAIAIAAPVARRQRR